MREYAGGLQLLLNQRISLKRGRGFPKEKVFPEIEIL